ncbi:MAG: ABC transporter ATP-binding protein [Candidatus Omnitrophota bacterium]
MDKPVISVKDLGKRYLLGTGGGESYRVLRDVMANSFKNLFKRQKKEEPQEIWALKNVSFDINAGDKVGIIGRNGAGKSTLLKILSEITEPTEGEARIRGRVVSLLEVGTGFHPELTGKENIYMNGAILGMKTSEIKKKYDEIVAFAEIEKFLDTPVKRYSSGMYVRLAFAVAAHLEPEIFLIDEVLSVGDAVFQKKCMTKMDEVSKSGRTILFVSHNMLAIQSLCQRTIYLENGVIADDGPSQQVIHKYLKGTTASTGEQEWNDPSTAPGNDEVRLRSARVRHAGSASGPGNITVRSQIELEFEYWNLVPDARLSLCPVVFNEQGVLVFGTTPFAEKKWYGKPLPRGLFRSVCRIPGDLLNNGTYRVDIYFTKNTNFVTYHKEGLLSFDVADSDELRHGYYGEIHGVIRPLLDWRTEFIDNPSAECAG